MINEFKKTLDLIIESFKEKANSFSVDSISPDIIKNLQVNTSTGGRVSLKALALISQNGQNSLEIKWFNREEEKGIEKALSSANIGQITKQSSSFLLSPPALTKERIDQMVKLFKDNMEIVKTQIRNQRQNILKEVKKNKNETEVSRMEKEIQKLVDNANDQIETLTKNIQNKFKWKS